MSSLFGSFSVDQVKATFEKPSNGGYDLYSPDPEKGKNNTYNSLIRFVPWYKDPSRSFIVKREFYLPKQDSQTKMKVDCPSALDSYSPLKELFFHLRKSNLATDKNISDNFRSPEYSYGLVQIIRDHNLEKPLSGAIKVMRVNSTVKELIVKQTQPAFGEPCVVWDPLKGKDMAISLKKKDGYNNWDDCEFAHQTSAMRVPRGFEFKEGLTENDLVHITMNDEAALIDYLEKNSPDLSVHEPKAWTKEDFDQIVEIVRDLVANENDWLPIFKKHSLYGNAIALGAPKGSGFLVPPVTEKVQPKSPTASKSNAADLASEINDIDDDGIPPATKDTWSDADWDD